MTPNVIAHDDPDAATRLLEALETGQVVVFPTDTVYGLGGNAWDDTALGKVRELKGRSSTQPFTLHVASLADVDRFASVPDDLRSAVRTLLPGPYTLLLSASSAAPPSAVADGKVGLRLPRHPFFQRVVARLARPLFGTSVNAHGEPPLNDVSQIIDRFPMIDLVVTGPVSGSPSDILDLTSRPPRAVRGTLPAVLAHL